MTDEATRPSVGDRLRALEPKDAPGWILLGLIVVGIALRIISLIAWWPVTTTLSDSWPYSVYADTNPFDNPQHPGGYSVVLKLLGIVSHDVSVPIFLQHALAIAAALLAYAAVRRITASSWAALFPAAGILLNADLIYLEHSIMSESLFVFMLAAGLYLCVRALDDPTPWWRWPLAAGLVLALATTVRSAGLFVIPVAAIALVVISPRPWRPRLPAAGVLLGAALVVLLAFAGANASSTGRFEVGPSQGWHLYQRVAPFADCSRFDPPEGTEQLCETLPAAKRPGGDFYLFDPKSPAVREYGYLGNDDGEVGSWARAAILAQPKDFLNAVWDDFVAFYVPSRHLPIPGSGGGLDPQLDWSYPVSALDPTAAQAQAKVERDTEAGMESFYNGFSVSRDAGLLGQLHDYQRVFRFGPLLLSITTMLALLGLFIGSRRSRIGVFLFGAGGVALLLAPVLGGVYVGRYAVPLTEPMLAAAAIAVCSLWRMESARRRVARAEAADTA